MDELSALKTDLAGTETRLAAGEFVELREFERDGRALHLVLTPRFYKLARRARLWGSTAMLVTLKNAGYGFDPTLARSLGGRDGIFLLDRGHDGPMSRKMYGRFLDRPGSGADELAAHLGTSVDQLDAVRLVSHHLRLLGALHRSPTADRLAIVDLERHAR